MWPRPVDRLGMHAAREAMRWRDSYSSPPPGGTPPPLTPPSPGPQSPALRLDASIRALSPHGKHCGGGATYFYPGNPEVDAEARRARAIRGSLYTEDHALRLYSPTAPWEGNSPARMLQRAAPPLSPPPFQMRSPPPACFPQPGWRPETFAHAAD